MAAHPKGRAGAISHEDTITAAQWESIDWDVVEANVRRLQARIVKAVQEGRWNKANSYGFRRGRCCADALTQCHIVLSRRWSAQWVLEGDIKSCFDRISHEWMLNNVPLDKMMLRQWLKAGYMEQQSLFPTQEGTPQGGIISPVLANMTLDGLETKLRERFPKTKAGCADRVHLIRYADDFVITGKSYDLLKMEVLPIVESFLGERGLELSPEKTSITHIRDGFDFLGQNVRRRVGPGKAPHPVLTIPSKKSIQAVLTKVRRIVQEGRSESAFELVEQLNPVIRGWANFHRHGASKSVFQHVDNAIHHCIYRWARRRHLTKPYSWIKAKYFTTVGGDNWVFHGRRTDREGKPQVRFLIRAGKTRIRRHVKIRADANPFDPAWYAYFNTRTARTRQSSAMTA